MRTRTNLLAGQTSVSTSVAAGGTTNQVAKFTGAYTIGNSLIADDGTTVTVAGALISDNGVSTNAPFIARDNGTPVFTVADGGVATFTNIIYSAGLYAATAASLPVGANDTTSWRFQTNGSLTPEADVAVSIGSSSKRLVELYANRIVHYASANNQAALNKILYGATTDAATAVELTTNGAAGSGVTNRIVVPADTALSVVINIAVKQSASANAKQMLRQFVIVNNGGTTSIAGAVAVLGTDSGSAGLATVTCTITANDTDDAIKVEVNGVIGTNLRYTAYLVSTETLYA